MQVFHPTRKQGHNCDTDTSALNPALELIRHTVTLNDYERVLAESSGERFNIFEILRIKHYEVGTHSPFLAELLNPRGRHGLGEQPLALFLRHLEIDNFDAQSAQVSIEYDAGTCTNEEGGRIDILISDRQNRQLLIENKIYAGDQDQQTQRYLNFSKLGLLLYLTLNGRSPSNYSGEKNERLRCISYQDHILPWLSACRKEASVAPTVRETLTQYIRLVQELTQQNTNTRMTTKLVDAVLQNEENLKAFVTLRNATSAVEDAIAVWLELQLKDVASTLKVELQMKLPLRQAYGGFRFLHPELTKHNVFIGFEFERTGCREFCVGFGCIDEKINSPLRDEFKKTLKSSGLGKVYESAYWPGWIVWERYENWNSADVLSSVRFGNFVEDSKAMTEKLLEAGLKVVANR
jgi:hypothetical protein